VNRESSVTFLSLVFSGEELLVQLEKRRHGAPVVD